MTLAQSPGAPTPGTPAALHALAEAWAGVTAAERANAQLYVTELCDALGVPRPRGAGSGYQFELPIKIGARDGTESQGFVDCYKAGHFVLEAKDAAAGASDAALRRAYGQARMYALNDPSGLQPPYLLVLDVGKTLLVWHRWGGTYQGYQAGHRIDLPTLHTRPADIALLRDIWLEPAKRDPRQHAQAVTAEIATKLATLAGALEARGFEQERVARFLMRVVFSCFAEDVDLLPRDAFRQTVERAGVAGDPERFARALEALWQAMDTGGMFGYESLLRFNGHFFQSAEALPLTREEIALLLEAAKADWKEVEPTIFGTLLTRALDPAERHRLGAEYTPRAFIERIVRPTVEEPVRERWTAVQAEVLQLTGTGKAKDRAAAEQRVRTFLGWLQGLRVLDPACGSGNFLYVTMHLLKEVEYEAVRELEALTGHPELRMQEIGPRNFLGIEVKPWAREIAELTLWIGFHQFWKRHHAVQPPEPVLQDTGTLELRDAVLAWDEIRHVPAKDRPDPTPRVVHPVTAELVPDPFARLTYLQHVNARPAVWPQADFIVGNPPYLGAQRKREVFGDGYSDALAAAYADLPDSVDYVMHWWWRAAQEVAAGRTIRAGLITTNSIVQIHNRSCIERIATLDVAIIWAIADHVWFDGADGAEVRVAMTVLGRDTGSARLLTVDKVDRISGEVRIVGETRVERLNADLSAHANVAGATDSPLLANRGLAYRGVYAMGEGFFLTEEEGNRLIMLDRRNRLVVRRIRNGKDLTSRARAVYLIDFGQRGEEEARSFPLVFDIARDRIKPARDANGNLARRVAWWRLGSSGKDLREAIGGLCRYIATPMTAKHRSFHFLDPEILPDQGVIAIASDDAFILGCLSSKIHEAWALAAGGRMGVRHTPRYNNAACFDAFPFPDPSALQRHAISRAALAIERHRTDAMERNDDVTVMKMYDIVEAIRAGRPLSRAQREIHEVAACGILHDLHDDLDALVAEAYGWPWPLSTEEILDRLVALHDERLEEEARGHVRWLRPEYQRPRFGVATDEEARVHVTNGAGDGASPRAAAEESVAPWPSDAIGQITVLRTMAAAAPLSVEEATRRLTGAKRELVQRHFETLALLGEVRALDDGRFALVASVL